MGNYCGEKTKMIVEYVFLVSLFSKYTHGYIDFNVLKYITNLLY